MGCCQSQEVTPSGGEKYAVSTNPHDARNTPPQAAAADESAAVSPAPTPSPVPASRTPEAVVSATTVAQRNAGQSLRCNSETALLFPGHRHFPTILHEGWLSKHLTKQMYDQLWRAGATRGGWNIDRAIQCALDYAVLDGTPTSGVGVLMGDAESYTLLMPLLRPIVKEFHGFDMGRDSHHAEVDSSRVRVANPDPEGDYIKSVRVRGGRQVMNMSFTTCASRAERRETERLLVEACGKLGVPGSYETRAGMDPERLVALRDVKGLMFDDPDLWTVLSGSGRDWPDARGVWVSDDEQVAVWVNEEDHMRCIVSHPGSSVHAAFTQWCGMVNGIESHLDSGYAVRPGIGALTPCPSQLGSGGFQVSVRVRLPLLGEKEWLKGYCREMGVRCRGHIKKRVGTGGVDSGGVGEEGAAGVDGSGGDREDLRYTGLFILSNIGCLGEGAASLVDRVLTCVSSLIGLERRLAGGEDVSRPELP